MAYARRRRYPYRRGFRRRRSFARHTKALRPRMEVANFNFSDILTLDGTENNPFVIFNMASIPLSFGENQDDSALAYKVRGMIRTIDVSGIIMSHGYENIGPLTETTGYNEVDESPSNLKSSIAQTFIYSTRLDVDGSPIGVDFPWSNSSGPFIFLGNTEEREDEDFPSRIHYRDATHIFSSRIPFSGTTATFVRNAFGHQNLEKQRRVRIRAKYEADQGLFLAFHLSRNLGVNGTFSTLDPQHVLYWATGTMYYRVRV